MGMKALSATKSPVLPEAAPHEGRVIPVRRKGVRWEGPRPINSRIRTRVAAETLPAQRCRAVLRPTSRGLPVEPTAQVECAVQSARMPGRDLTRPTRVPAPAAVPVWANETAVPVELSLRFHQFPAERQKSTLPLPDGKSTWQRLATNRPNSKAKHHYKRAGARAVTDDPKTLAHHRLVSTQHIFPIGGKDGA